METKRRRVLEGTRDIDADSGGTESESSDEDRYASTRLYAMDHAYLIWILPAMRKMRRLSC